MSNFYNATQLAQKARQVTSQRLDKKTGRIKRDAETGLNDRANYSAPPMPRWQYKILDGRVIVDRSDSAQIDTSTGLAIRQTRIYAENGYALGEAHEDKLKQEWTEHFIQQEMRLMFHAWTLDQIKEYNHAAGYKWFSSDHLSTDRTRLLIHTYQGKGGVFFIASTRRLTKTIKQSIFLNRQIKTRTTRLFVVFQFHPFSGLVESLDEVQSKHLAIQAAIARADGQIKPRKYVKPIDAHLLVDYATETNAVTDAEAETETETKTETKIERTPKPNEKL